MTSEIDRNDEMHRSGESTLICAHQGVQSGQKPRKISLNGLLNEPNMQDRDLPRGEIGRSLFEENKSYRKSEKPLLLGVSGAPQVNTLCEICYPGSDLMQNLHILP
jgi:hypothetical protein